MVSTTNKSIVLRKDIPDTINLALNGVSTLPEARDKLHSSLKTFITALNTHAANEVGNPNICEISLAANQCFENVFAADKDPRNACRAGISIMFEKYYQTERGKLDECINRIYAFVSAYFVESSMPDNYHEDIVEEKLIPVFYASINDLSKDVPNGNDNPKADKIVRDIAMAQTLKKFYSEIVNQINLDNRGQ